MSAGGYGHIPIPLVKGTLAYVEPPLAFENQIAFFGEIQLNFKNADITRY